MSRTQFWDTGACRVHTLARTRALPGRFATFRHRTVIIGKRNAGQMAIVRPGACNTNRLKISRARDHHCISVSGQPSCLSRRFSQFSTLVAGGHSEFDKLQVAFACCSKCPAIRSSHCDLAGILMPPSALEMLLNVLRRPLLVPPPQASALSSAMTYGHVFSYLHSR
ncbi:hypothetical protein BDR05DRAFT_680110 [Suillus weaverae]|nr:hypothetical protein BDR05DRAFT_680110 [Suillus weaverae]